MDKKINQYGAFNPIMWLNDPYPGRYGLRKRVICGKKMRL